MSDLLSATCHLVGSQAWHDYSTQNESLYEEVKKKLSLVMLNPPMENPELWAMLVLSTWSLGPATSGHFIDSWLLSGSTMLYSLLSYGFSSYSTPESFGSQDQMTRDRILAWNASALVHLKSVTYRNDIESLPDTSQILRRHRQTLRIRNRDVEPVYELDTRGCRMQPVR